MAVVTLTIMAGRDSETLDRLHQALADAVVRELPAKPEHVRTIIHEVRGDAYAVGGRVVARTLDEVHGQ